MRVVRRVSVNGPIKYRGVSSMWLSTERISHVSQGVSRSSMPLAPIVFKRAHPRATSYWSKMLTWAEQLPPGHGVSLADTLGC